MLWQAGSDLTKLSEVLRPRVGRTAVIKVISVKIPELFVAFVSAAECLIVYGLKKLKSLIFERFFKVYIHSIFKNFNESVTIFMFSQAADGLFDYIKRISP